MKKMTICLTIVFMLFSLFGCGKNNQNNNNEEPSTECTHIWKSATCENPKTCSLCSKTEGEALGHSWYAATCEKPKTCSLCSKTEGEALGHSWEAATCVNPKTCSVCGKTNGEPLGHTTSNGECYRCKEYIGTRPASPQYISNRSINHDDNNGYFYFLFSFLDENDNEMKCGATVKIRIVNSKNETVYSKTHTVTEKDFGIWENKYYNEEWLAASIYIHDSDITPGLSTSGKIYYTITASDGSYWKECSLDISGDLPVKQAKIILPTLPKTITEFSYSGNVYSTVKITNITYEISDDDLYIYFTGEKTYDMEGDRYSSTCVVGWKLYDSEGYIVDSGTFYSPKIAVGEKFRDEEDYAWDVIEPGEVYTLVISNVG